MPRLRQTVERTALTASSRSVALASFRVENEKSSYRVRAFSAFLESIAAVLRLPVDYLPPETLERGMSAPESNYAYT